MYIPFLFKLFGLEFFTLWGTGKGGSAPKSPDPYTVAGATTQTNEQSAAYNKALNLNNYSNPFGSQQSQQIGTDPNSGAPIYNSSITLNPQIQDSLNGLLSQAQNSGTAISNGQWGVGSIINQYGNLNNGLMGLGSQYGGLNSQLQGLGSSLDMNAVKAAQQQGQDAAYSSQTQYLDPQFSQGSESLDAKLANQGLTPGSQAYDNAMLNFNNQKQQAYSNAQNQSILTGSQIGAQNLQNQLSGINTQAGLLGQQGSNIGATSGLYGMQSSNLGAMGAGYGQIAGMSQLPYSNLSTLASLIPGYSGPAQTSTSPANIGSDVYSSYQGNLNAYNAQQQSANQTMGGLFGLGSAGIMAYGLSDRRAKKNIRRLGTLRNGLPWYSFTYITGANAEGVMADEVEKIMPSAVHTHATGLKMVNYAEVL